VPRFPVTSVCYNTGMKLKTFWMAIAALAVVRLALMATVPVFEPSEARYAATSAYYRKERAFWQEWARIPEAERPPAVEAFGNFKKAMGRK